jgi:asparagine synthase (glutamine-hydrolysing)
MCGILGAVNWGDRHSLERMTELQFHRGPDDGGVWEQRLPDGGWVGLGSRRLSIIDLSSAGHMPMSSDDGTLHITYNGEIYNFRELRAELQGRGHQFRSRTDTEVLLHLYQEMGAGCLRKLNGMFAFAIWDSDKRELFLARDHFGIKPLYYMQQGQRFAFASEIKSLFALPGCPREISLEALNQYLNFLWVPDPLTMLDGIFKLLAGHYAVFKNGSLTVWQYWDLEFPSLGEAFPGTETQIVEELRERFQIAVRRQMVSDVPLGAFLSAGLDSSSIVAMMSRASSEPIRTYCITFPKKYLAGENTLDDPDVARRVAAHFGCEHEQICVEPDVADLLPKLIWHMDEPIADPAIILAYLVCRAAREKVTVLLSGVGGDELFAGYRKHSAYPWSRLYRRIPAFARKRLLEPAVLALPGLRGSRLKSPVRLAKKMARSGALSPRDAFLMNCTYFDAAQRAALYSPELRAATAGMNAWSRHEQWFDRVAHADFINQMLYLDIKTFMVSLNLTYNDKMSMASSVETRVPFLDVELVEFAARNVPPSLKLNGTFRVRTKHVLRKAMQGVLPAEVLAQPKAGFGAPIDNWLAGELREMVGDLLSPDQVRRRGLFAPEAVQTLLAEHQRGSENWGLHIWQLLTLELWTRTFRDGNPADCSARVAAMVQ